MKMGNREPAVPDLDHRVRSHLGSNLGSTLASFPSSGIEVRESSQRTDERESRLSIVGIGNAALATGIPRIVAAISPAVRSMTTRELFSPLGLAELRRAMEPEDAESLAHGLDYTLTDVRDLRPAETPHAAVALTKKDIPPKQYELRMSERRPPDEADEQDFVWAFACRHDDENAEATELAPFGPRCASVAIVTWKTRDLAEYGVWTEEAYRGRGYALAAVSAATRYVLERGAVAAYGAFATNIPSLRIARRLGYSFAWQTIWA
jgi:RimJ/RimL family protein N-acetyltransferase